MFIERSGVIIYKDIILRRCSGGGNMAGGSQWEDRFYGK